MSCTGFFIPQKTCISRPYCRPLSTYLSTYFLNDLSSFLVFCSLITIFPSQRMVMAKCCGTYFKSGLFLSIEISGHVLNSFSSRGQTHFENEIFPNLTQCKFIGPFILQRLNDKCRKVVLEKRFCKL